MKNIFYFVVFTIAYTWFASFASADEEQSKTIRMFTAIQENDLDSFIEFLESGVDVNQPTVDQRFGSSSLCESTKPGNEVFFDSIMISGAPLDQVSNLGGPFGSAINCSVFYDNFSVYRKLVENGVDLSAIQNPGAKNPKLFKQTLDVAISSRRFNFIWDIIQQVDVSDRHMQRLVRSVEGNGGIEGHPNEPYRQKLIQWLRDRDIPVNPTPPAHKSLYETKK